MKFRLFLLLLPFIVQAQQSIPGPIVDGSAGCWPFDGNANDLSGNNNHGAGTNVVYTYNRFNQPNMAVRFNGVNSKVVVPHSATIDFSTGVSFSFTYWQKTYPGNVDAVIITKHTYGNWDGYNFIANNQANSGYCTGVNHMYWYVASAGQQDACSDGPVLADTLWHFIAGVYDAGPNRSYLYIDGVQQADVGQRGGTVSSPADLSFGCDDDINDLFYNGVLDDACLYPRALSSSEVLAMYNAGSAMSVEDQSLTGPELVLLPNPAADKFSIRIKEMQGLLTARIFDQLGQQVMTSGVPAGGEMTVADLPDGLYYVTVDSEDGRSLSRKLLICR